MTNTDRSSFYRFLEDKERDFVLEPAKRVPIASEADVVVVGGGISGIFAAIAAGRKGVRTVLIDRMGSLGGNIGPGYFIGGNMKSGMGTTCPGGASGIPAEFMTRLNELSTQTTANYAETSNIASYLATTMAQDAGVELILSAYASDPIVENNIVKGLFVEGKSGRVAITAGAVIDATGDADVAMRAGAPVMNFIPADPSYAGPIKDSSPYNSPDFPLYNEGGIYFNIGGVDYERYKEFAFGNDPSGTGFGFPLSDDDKKWATENLWGMKVQAFPYALVPALRREWESGGFRTVREIEPGLLVSSQGSIDKFDGRGVVGARAASVAGRFATYDMAQLSRIEAAVRIQAFETVEFLRKNAPGFENAYILFMSPFLGARGGPCIEGEHVLTPKETSSSCKFDDVILSVAPRIKKKTDDVEPAFEAPYRMLLPKKIDGLLASGRSASYIRRGHDPSFRRRPIAMLIGQVTGTAAALSVKLNVTPKTLDIKTLQRQLVQDGIYLGDEERLRELQI